MSIWFLYSAEEQDLVLIGMIAAGINTDAMTASTKRKKQTARERQRTVYAMGGRQICRQTFMHMHKLVLFLPLLM